MPDPNPHGPRLESLLDQRDRLRIKISLAEQDGLTSDQEIGELRRQLLIVDHSIIQHWGDTRP